jgi:hypothetical protein
MLDFNVSGERAELLVVELLELLGQPRDLLRAPDPVRGRGGERTEPIVALDELQPPPDLRVALHITQDGPGRRILAGVRESERVAIQSVRFDRERRSWQRAAR